MLRRLLYLNEGDLSRIWPFFLLYLLLFAAFSLADGLSQSLFVQEVGSDQLPLAYGGVALSNLVVMALYIYLAERAGSVFTFILILGGSALVFAFAWIALSLNGSTGWYASIYVGREIGITLMLMHFGTFLNDFFTRLELNRVFPVIYSGGRVGGIIGGFLLQHLAGPWGLVNLILVFVVCCLVGLGLIVLIARLLSHVSHPEDHISDAGIHHVLGTADLEDEARRSARGFLRFVWVSPLLFWITITSILFILCRWMLNFQYSEFFARHFSTDQDMAEFLGLYTQIALLGSLVVQVLVVNRLVDWIGLKGAHLVYGALLLLSMFLCVGEMTFALAVFSRLMETELRFGLRNPIMQLITNKFSKGLRVRVRAWSLGMVIPLATLLSSVLLGVLVRAGWAQWVALLGAGCGLLYLIGSVAMVRSFREEPRSAPSTGTTEETALAFPTTELPAPTTPPGSPP